MSKPTQIGCKKCGAVITLEIRSGSDKYEIRTKDATVQERSGKVQVCCKKCRNPVASVTLDVL